MKLGFVGIAALVASCGGAKMAGHAAGMPSIAAGPTATGATSANGSGATIATDDAPRPAPGQLTAGVWDDNLNYAVFAAYARELGQRSRDLGAFGEAEQRASHDRFAQRGARQELDVQLVLDTTGSMGDELAYLTSEFEAIAKQVREHYPNITPHWSLVLYKDHGDEYVTRPFNFTTDTARFQHDLAAQSAGGGGDFPEAVVPAFEKALAQGWRSGDGVAKLIFWVADAPPHPGEGGQLAELARKARDMGIHVYPVASSGIDDGTEYQMRATAQLTGGRYLFLTNDSGIGYSHAEPHIPCYAVTKLDHAVVRMIDSEMTGQRAITPPDQVVRRVGSPDAAGVCTVHETQVVAF